jgi:phage gp36-like protein
MSYATIDDLNMRFGSPNVTKWADLEGDGSMVAIRISTALAYADSHINLALRGGGYSVPVIATTSDVLTQITDWATVIAGHWLYASRGLLDEDKQKNKLDNLFTSISEKLDGVRAGKVRLDVRRWAPNPNAPGCM